METDPTHGETETEAETDPEAETGATDQDRTLTGSYTSGAITLTQEYEIGRWVTVTQAGDKLGRTTLSRVATLAEVAPEDMRNGDLRRAIEQYLADDD